MNVRNHLLYSMNLQSIVFCCISTPEPDEFFKEIVRINSEVYIIRDESLNMGSSGFLGTSIDSAWNISNEYNLSLALAPAPAPAPAPAKGRIVPTAYARTRQRTCRPERRSPAATSGQSPGARATSAANSSAVMARLVYGTCPARHPRHAADSPVARRAGTAAARLPAPPLGC